VSKRSRVYYWANREKVLEKAAARRGRTRPPERSNCSECSARLRDARGSCARAAAGGARDRRLHPEAYAEKERRKVARRREADGSRVPREHVPLRTQAAAEPKTEAAEHDRPRLRTCPSAPAQGTTPRSLRLAWRRARACGLPITPGQAWDLGHVDGDRSRYARPEHRHSRDCPEGGNLATARRRPEPPPWRIW
jgi:hypothetical protein